VVYDNLSQMWYERSGECVNYNWYYSYEWAPTLTDIRQFQQTCKILTTKAKDKTKDTMCEVEGLTWW
jgi:5'-3' exonuclease